MDTGNYTVQDDIGLWEELNHHHTREAEQHHAATQQQNRFDDSWSVLIWARALAYQSADELRRVGSVFYDAAAGAYVDQQTAARLRRVARPPHHQYSNANSSKRGIPFFRPNTANLDEFGIPAHDPLQQGADCLYTVHEDQQQHDQQQQHDSNFVFLPNIQFRPENEGWASVANLDMYFQSLYSYFYHRGFIPIIGKGIVELVTLFFTLFLSVFLFAFVDWKRLSHCTDEQTCEADFAASYIIKKPFQTFSLWNTMVILYCLLFCVYSAFAVLSFVNTIQLAVSAKWVYEERLGISARKLIGGAVDWDRDVVSKLVALQQSGEYRVAIHNRGDDLNALTISNRILRKENFLVALFNRGLLDLKVPFASSFSDTFFCASLEWCLYFCVLNFMYNHRYQIRPAFYLDPRALRRRLRLCGIVHLILMPFLLFFVTLYFGLQNAYDWKSTKQYLGPREWSLPAKWTFREFNELPHIFERRLAPSYQAAEGYLALFGSNELVAALGRILVFIGGSLGAVLFAFAAVNDAILLHVKIADWNLLWYAGVFGVVYSVGKALIPDAKAQPNSARNLFAEIDEALANVASHTHFFPETWKGRGWDRNTNQAFSSLFQYKAKLFATELLSLMFSPYILCVSLVNCAEPICEFVLATRVELPGAGEVCGYATFDFEKFSDERWSGRTMGHVDSSHMSLSESILQTGNVDEATRHFPKPKARFGKMEKSLIGFKDAHPSWVCSPSGQNVVDQAEQICREELIAQDRERELHRNAAARQLETLERIQGRVDNETINDALIPTMNESYIQTADAGAGVVRQDVPKVNRDFSMKGNL